MSSSIVHAFAPFDSGITQEEVDHAMQALVERKTRDVISLIGTHAETLSRDARETRDLTDSAIGALLTSIESAVFELESARIALRNRYEALARLREQRVEAPATIELKRTA